jgi:hypothetical protein
MLILRAKESSALHENMRIITAEPVFLLGLTRIGKLTKFYQ